MEFKRITYKLCMMSAASLLAGAIGVAQQMPQNPSSMPQQQPPSAPPGGYPGNAATGEEFGEKEFISKGLQSDQTELQMDEVAEQKSQSNDVKQLAQKLAANHTQMDEKWFKPLAKQMGVSEPKGPSKKDKKMAEKMQALPDADFDAQYLTMVLKDCQKDLKDFQDEAKVAQNPSVKQVAEMGASLMSQYLQLIGQIAKSHNVDTGDAAKPSM